MTLEERLAHIAAAKEKYRTKIPWLADSIENDLKHALGDRPNSEFIVGPDGKILIAQSWSDPALLRENLEKLVGKAETFTEAVPFKASDKAVDSDAKSIAKGVVPRVARPAGGSILQTNPIEVKVGQPLYVKLRAEASSSLLKGEKGTIHLGFHIDPVHHVHWNNLAPPLKFEIIKPEGIDIESTEGAAAKVEEFEADSDPREFLIQVDPKGSVPTQPLKIRVTYFACDDNDEWCKTASQEFEIEWKQDKDAGTAQSRGGRASGGRPGSKGNFNAKTIMSRLDANGDGVISKNEARGPIQQRFSQLDENKDGSLSSTELEKMTERMRNR